MHRLNTFESLLCLASESFLALPRAWLPFSFGFAGLDDLNGFPFNGLPLPRLQLLVPVVPFFNAEVFNIFSDTDLFALLAAAALRRCRAVSSLGSSRVLNALQLFLTQ